MPLTTSSSPLDVAWALVLAPRPLITTTFSKPFEVHGVPLSEIDSLTPALILIVFISPGRP